MASQVDRNEVRGIVRKATRLYESNEIDKATYLAIVAAALDWEISYYMTRKLEAQNEKFEHKLLDRLDRVLA